MIVILVIMMFIVASLGGCSLTSNFHMKCKGECEASVERGVSSGPTLPTLPIPTPTPKEN